MSNFQFLLSNNIEFRKGRERLDELKRQEDKEKSSLSAKSRCGNVFSISNGRLCISLDNNPVDSYLVERANPDIIAGISKTIKPI